MSSNYKGPLRVVVVRPGEHPVEETLPGNTLEHAQKVVGGYIEVVHRFGRTPVAIVLNEEGMIRNMTKNSCGFYGPFFLVGLKGGHFRPLTDEEARKAVAWAEAHRNDPHPNDPSSRMVTDPEEIRTIIGDNARASVAAANEWASL